VARTARVNELYALVWHCDRLAAEHGGTDAAPRGCAGWHPDAISVTCTTRSAGQGESFGERGTGTLWWVCSARGDCPVRATLMKNAMTMHCDRRKRKRVVPLLVFGLLTFCTACTSPEARRTRGGGPGADIGNRDAVVEMHGNVQPYNHTPCLEPLRQC